MGMSEITQTLSEGETVRMLGRRQVVYDANNVAVRMVCSVCQRTLPLSAFKLAAGSHLGIRKMCKECEKAPVAKKAEIQMNSQRFKHIFRDLPEQSKRIFSHVPCAEAWTAYEILQELYRSGARTDIRTLTGCLNALRSVRLVTEDAQHKFQRASILAEVVQEAMHDWKSAKSEPEPAPHAPTPKTSTPQKNTNTEKHMAQKATITAQSNNAVPPATATINKVTPSPTGPLDVLAELSVRALEIVKEVQDLSDRIDAAAILLDEQNKAREADTAKLRQLQTLLKSLGE